MRVPCLLLLLLLRVSRVSRRRRRRRRMTIRMYGEGSIAGVEMGEDDGEG
jgi:hypothetical protein